MAGLEIEFLVKNHVSKEVKKINDDLNNLRKQIGNTNNELPKFTNSLLKVAGGFVALNSAADLSKSFIKTADAMTSIDSKLKLVTNSTKELLDTQSKIFDMAQNTRTSFAGNIELYHKMFMATRSLSTSQEDLLIVSEAVSKSLAISGTNAQGAESLILQFSQALSSDFKAVSQEINTLKEQAPSLYQEILKGTNLTASQFKKMAEEGKL